MEQVTNLRLCARTSTLGVQGVTCTSRRSRLESDKSWDLWHFWNRLHVEDSSERSMETIGQQELWSFVGGSSSAKKFIKNTEIRRDAGHLVTSFIELATKIAELQFRNRDHVLLFRGQHADYRNLKRHTTLKPTLFRSVGKLNPDGATLIERFQALQRAEEQLGIRYQGSSFLGMERACTLRFYERSAGTCDAGPRHAGICYRRGWTIAIQVREVGSGAVQRQAREETAGGRTSSGDRSSAGVAKHRAGREER
jgi:hypothetical protein